MCVHQYPHTTHKCVSITPVCICLGALWGTRRNLVAGAASGKKVGITFHCRPFVPFEFCTMYMYYLLKNKVFKFGFLLKK